MSKASDFIKFKIIGHHRKVARGQIDPIKRASNELKELGYVFVEDNPDILLLQTYLCRPEDKDNIINNLELPTILLDDAASTGTHKFRALNNNPKVIGYIKKQLIENRNLYKTLFPRKRYHYYILSSFDDSLSGKIKIDRHVNDEVLSKVHLGWNLGLTEREGMAIIDNPTFNLDRPIDLHFSIKVQHTSKKEKDNLSKIDTHYTHHRTTCYNEIDRISKKHDLTVSGNCRGKDYLDKMSKAKICISPLGLGEICWRDFEAISNGAILLKPCMSYIETWPNIYRPWDTYIPVMWDWSDLENVLLHILTNYEEYKVIADKAYKVMQNAWDSKVFAEKFDSIIKNIIK